MTDSHNQSQLVTQSAQMNHRASVQMKSAALYRRLSAILFVAILLAVSVISLAFSALGTQSVLAQAENQIGILAVAGADGADLYETPGGAQVRRLSAGTSLNATGRSADNNWVMVTLPSEESGWVEVQHVVLFGLANLPAVFGDSPAMDPTAAIQATEASQEEATPTSLPTEPPTPTPTPSPTPTFTATPTLPPTVAPTPIPANSATILAVVRGGGAMLLESPGGASMSEVTVGSTLNALAVSDDDKWIQVRTRDGAAGWVDAKQVIAFQLENLPRVAVEVSADNGSTGDSAMADADATTPAEEEPGTAVTPAASTAPSPSASTNLPSAQTQIRRPVPEIVDGQIMASIAMSGSRLNIRSAPGVGSVIIGKALPNEQFIALARTQDSAWIQLEVPDIDAGAGWVSAQFVELSEPISDLPISDEEPVEVNPTDNSGSTAPPADAAKASESSPVAVKAAAAPGLTGRLVFQTALGGSIYVYDLASGQLRKLTGGGDPAISPDGSMVAFSRFGGDGGVYVINIDGSGERRLYASAEGPRSPNWSPDGKYIVFSRLTGEYPCRYIGFGICLPNTPFTRQLPLVKKEERGLSRIDLNGENFRDIPALNTAKAPDWTSSGIVYQATTSIEITYDTPDYEGSHVFNEIVGYQDPAWQPGGGRILYQDKGPDHTEIWSVNPDGSSNRPLTRPLTTLVKQLPSNVSPAWSPDGQHIVYLSSRGPDESEGPWRLWVMDAGGENKRPLPIDLEFVYHHNVEQMVSWGR